MPAKGYRKRLVGDVDDSEGFKAWVLRHLDYLRVRGYSERGLRSRESALGLFLEWAHQREVTRPTQVTTRLLDEYAEHCFLHRQKNGKPLTVSTQRQRLQVLRSLFKYLKRERVVVADPTTELELPRSGNRLPRAVLTAAEAERVMAVPDTSDDIGLRDRTMMEVLYATGMRRFELTGLRVADVDRDRGTITIREGKGRKDRVVPVSRRALDWLYRYERGARPRLLRKPGEATLFLEETGDHRAGAVDPHHAPLHCELGSEQVGGGSHLAALDGDVDARERGGLACDSGDSRARGVVDDADLHAGVDSASAVGLREDAPGGVGGDVRVFGRKYSTRSITRLGRRRTERRTRGSMFRQSGTGTPERSGTRRRGSTITGLATTRVGWGGGPRRTRLGWGMG